MKSCYSLLLILCSLSMFSQNTASSADYEKITLDGKPAFINVKTGEIVTNRPTTAAYSSPTAKQYSKNTATVATNASAHLVVKGETLYSISKKYGTSIAELTALNPTININALRINQEIIVNKSVAQATSTSTSNDTASATSYVVKTGDTLYSISRMFGVSVSDLTSMNNLTSSLISIGQNLTIK